MPKISFCNTKAHVLELLQEISIRVIDTKSLHYAIIQTTGSVGLLLFTALYTADRLSLVNEMKTICSYCDKDSMKVLFL